MHGGRSFLLCAKGALRHSKFRNLSFLLCFAPLILSQVAAVGEVSGSGVFLSLAFSLAAVHFLDAEALQVGTLIGVSTLYLTNSNVIASPLWPVPSEERSKIRMLFYYACCPAGCLWTGQTKIKQSRKTSHKIFFKDRVIQNLQ